MICRDVVRHRVGPKNRLEIAATASSVGAGRLAMGAGLVLTVCVPDFGGEWGSKSVKKVWNRHGMCCYRCLSIGVSRGLSQHCGSTQAAAPLSLGDYPGGTAQRHRRQAFFSRRAARVPSFWSLRFFADQQFSRRAARGLALPDLPIHQRLPPCAMA